MENFGYTDYPGVTKGSVICSAAGKLSLEVCRVAEVLRSAGVWVSAGSWRERAGRCELSELVG